MRKLLLLAALLPALAQAEQSPPPGKLDPRVRVVAYNPLDIVAINTYYGVSTNIEFAQGEVVQEKSMDAGDRKAWSIKVSEDGQLLYLRPIAKNADTNLTIKTNRRKYLFLLNVLAAPATVKVKGNKKLAVPIYSTVAARSHQLTYALTFTYPEDEQAKGEAASAKRAADELRERLAAAKNRATNYDYWVAGDDEVSPINARDDGRFIYLTFAPNVGRPAISSIDRYGKPTAVNATVDGNTIIVPLARQLRLEKGDLVACIINRSYNPNAGTDNASGTISPDVVRVLKGEQ